MADDMRQLFEGLFPDAESLQDESLALKFLLEKSMPLICLVFLLSLEAENEEHLLEQRLQLVGQTNEGFLEKLLASIENESDVLAYIDKAIEAIKAGDIQSDEFDGANSRASFVIVDTVSFFKWAEKQGVTIDEDTYHAVEFLADQQYYHQRSVEEFERNFPRLEAEEFQRLQKEPLWTVCNAIIHMQGRKSNVQLEKEIAFVQHDQATVKLLNYLVDAINTDDLKLYPIQGGVFEGVDVLASLEYIKVRPTDFVNWAKGLPLELPILVQQQSENQVKKPLPKYMTAEMQLMLDAAEHFWFDYDLDNPDPSRAPYKKDVVEWLRAEAKTRKIEGFSKNLAESINTLIRCPISRQGGNTR